MGSPFICPICGNKDLNLTGIRKGVRYCRVCIKFQNNRQIEKTNPKGYRAYLSYKLSREQEVLSDKLLSNYKNNVNSLVHAVCGAGKTEIVLKVISYALKNKLSIGFAIPRKDVVIEIYQRLKEIFLDNTVVAVYGGNTSILSADIICLTTHQLYRYTFYFDLLIMDEIDAFPFKDNRLLNHFFVSSLKGPYILLSATPNKETIDYFSQDGFEVLHLNHRFHGYDLPIPEFKRIASPFDYFYLVFIMKKLIKNKKRLFVFFPTILLSESGYKFIKFFIPNGNVVHSKKENRNEIIQSFKNGNLDYLVTTSVLERGVTVKDLQVIVMHANHEIYDEYSLEQISGRVGRKKDAPTGKVIFIANEINDKIEKSISSIKEKNNSL
ncbi:MAG: helicase-related protein [Bacilli bacterium]